MCHSPDNVILIEPLLVAVVHAVKTSVMDVVVISFRQNVDIVIGVIQEGAVYLDNTMNDRDFFSRKREDNYLSQLNVLASVMMKREKVSSIERWLHTPAQNYDDWAFARCENHKAFPDHQGRTDNARKIQHLCHKLPFVGIVQIS
tara:strand:+ start:1865 stop:2299 length:435 start_codon:yes stop_codon:yes gene_type:complete